MQKRDTRYLEPGDEVWFRPSAADRPLCRGIVTVVMDWNAIHVLAHGRREVINHDQVVQVLGRV